MQLIILGVEMELFSIDFVGVILMFLVFTGIIWLPLTWVAMLLLTPKILVQKYFKEPHFSKTELGLLSVFPGTLGRTGIFMGATFQERYRRNRKLEGYLDHVPSWYVKVSKVFTFCSLTLLILVFSLTGGGVLYLWLDGRL